MVLNLCCISSVSYIKPQLAFYKKWVEHVVYRPFPTSNHNLFVGVHPPEKLYIVRFLHQTTTNKTNCYTSNWLYIVRFLHQTTTLQNKSPLRKPLYIVRFLHQTTTSPFIIMSIRGCISSVSYIKPQRCPPLPDLY